MAPQKSNSAQVATIHPSIVPSNHLLQPACVKEVVGAAAVEGVLKEVRQDQSEALHTAQRCPGAKHCPCSREVLKKKKCPTPWMKAKMAVSWFYRFPCVFVVLLWYILFKGHQAGKRGHRWVVVPNSRDWLRVWSFKSFASPKDIPLYCLARFFSTASHFKGLSTISFHHPLISFLITSTKRAFFNNT